jgi:hypothetical protein
MALMSSIASLSPVFCYLQLDGQYRCLAVVVQAAFAPSASTLDYRED